MHSFPHSKKTDQLWKLCIHVGIFAFILTTWALVADSAFAAQGDTTADQGLLGLQALSKIIGTVIQFIGFAVFTFAAIITSWTGQLLDFFIEMSLNTNSYGLDGIEVGWQVFRDLVNIVFIFFVLYIGFMTILQGSNFETRRILINLVLVGIFVNFSFFLTGLVIDIGNIAAGSIYNAITTDTVKVGGKLNEALNLGQILAASEASTLDDIMTGIIYLLSALLLMVASFVFFAGGFLFISRTVILMVLLLLSPVAFVAMILPNTRRRFFEPWFGRLIGNTFLAPIFLLLIGVVILIADTPGLQALADGTVGTGNPLAAQASASKNPFFGVSGLIINFVILIGLMVAALSIAKQMAGEIGNLSTKWAGKLTGAGVGAVGILGRNTLGRNSATALQKYGDKWHSDAYDPKKNFVTRYAARARLKSYDAMQRSSFDARNSKKISTAFGSTVGSALGAGGVQVNLGKGRGQKGFRGTLDTKAKKHEEFAESLGQLDDDHEDVVAKDQEISRAKIELRDIKQTGDRKNLRKMVNARRQEVKRIDAEITEREQLLADPTQANDAQLQEELAQMKQQKAAEEQAVQRAQTRLTSVEQAELTQEKKVKELEKERIEVKNRPKAQYATWLQKGDGKEAKGRLGWLSTRTQNKEFGKKVRKKYRGNKKDRIIPDLADTSGSDEETDTTNDSGENNSGSNNQTA